MTERILRYVELDASGNPFHEATAAWDGGQTEGEAWAQLVVDATQKGHSVVRLANGRYAQNPRLEDIEGDGNGGFRAKPGRTLTGVEIYRNA